MIPTDRFEQVTVDRITALWHWLATNHARAEGVWLVTAKITDPARYIPMDQQLDALVAWGWTDGLRRKLDESWTMQLISPRKQQVWAQTYRDRATRLIADGRMQPPGLVAVQAAQASGTWNAANAVDLLHPSPDLAAHLMDLHLTDRFADLAPSYRRNILRWLWQAKGADTRAKRIAAIAESARTGNKMPNF